MNFFHSQTQPVVVDCYVSKSTENRRAVEAVRLDSGSLLKSRTLLREKERKMPETEAFTPLSTESIERKFLCLDRDTPLSEASGASSVDELLSALMVLNECAAIESRDQCSMVFQQYLVDQREFESLIKLLKLRAEWLGDPVVYGEECRDILVSGTKDRMLVAKVESVLLGKERPLACLKRLELLVALVPGVACYDKTWGYGIVKRLDDFYQRIVVDFERKPEHTMAFSYAAQSLRLLDDRHILSLRHADREAFDEKCRKHAGEVVALALNSFGQMSISSLEAELMGGILPEGLQWKSFWTQARTQLKKDKRFKLPPATRKNEPIEFAKTASQLGDAGWFTALGALTDVPEIIDRIYALTQLRPQPEITPQIRELLAGRLSFALKGAATTRNDKEKVRTILLALTLGFKELPVELRSRQTDEFAMANEEQVDLAATLWKPEIILNAAPKMPVTQMSELVARIPLTENKEVANSFIEKLHDIPSNLLETIAPPILEGPASAMFAEQVRKEFSDIDISFALILWLCRNQDKEMVCSILPASVVATQALLALEPEVMGENLRLQHLIANQLRDEKWLETQTARMTEVERAAFYARVRAADGAWEPLKKRAVEKFLARLYPVLAESGTEDLVPDIVSTQRYTSWRSLNERAEKHRNLVEKEIPQNNVELEAARSLGDLRENFEYQTAKEQQRILINRQAELDLALREMKGTDFSHVELADKTVVMGCAVTLQHADGHTSTYHILGEWDSDLALGIISSRSRMAECLLTHSVGENVQIPGSDGELEAVVIASVQPLSRTILDWASGR